MCQGKCKVCKVDHWMDKDNCKAEGTKRKFTECWICKQKADKYYDDICKICSNEVCYFHRTIIQNLTFCHRCISIHLISKVEQS